MDTNKYLVDPNVVVKKEVEDPIEVPICPPSIAKDFSLNKAGASTEMLNTTQLLPFVNELVQNDILQRPSTLSVSNAFPSLHIDRPQVGSTVPVETMQLASLEGTLQNSQTLPTGNKVVKPKKRTKKRYVFSKRKKRSRKKPELPTVPLLESYNKLLESNDEVNESDGSSDTIIGDDNEDHMATTSTKELFSAGEVTRPLELGRLLISKGVVRMLPNNSQGVQNSSKEVKVSNKPLETFPLFENPPLLSAVKKELVETNVVDAKQPDIDVPHVTSIDNSQNKKPTKMPVSQDFSLPYLYNDIESKKSGRKQTARRGKGKPNSVRSSNRNTTNILESFLEIGSATLENTSNPLADQFQTTVLDPSLKSIVSETAIKEKPARKKPATKKNDAAMLTVIGTAELCNSTFANEELLNATVEKPKRKRAATPRKSPKKNVSFALPTEFEAAKCLNPTLSGEFLNSGINEQLDESWAAPKPKRKKAATPRKSQKKNVSVALPTPFGTAEFLEAATANETLLSTAPCETSKKPARKKAANPRKSPKKKSTETVEYVENTDLSENVGSAKQKRKRTPPKKGVEMETNSNSEAVLLDKSEVVESCLVLSVKKELDKAAPFDSSSPSCSTNSPTFGSANNSVISNLTGTTIVSLSFEEDVSKKEDNIDKASLLLAFKKRNAKGQFIKSPKSSKVNISVSEEESRDLTSNRAANTCLSNKVQKALPLSYLSNFELTKPSSADSVSANVSNSAAAVLEHLKSNSFNQSGDGLSLNLNIKQEPTNTAEGESTTVNSFSITQQSESQISEKHLLNQSILTASSSVADFTSLPTTKRKQTARRGRRGTPTRQQSSRLSSEFLNDQPTPIASDACISSPTTPKRKQTARRGKRGTLIGQQQCRAANQSSSTQSNPLLSGNNGLDPVMVLPTITTQRKQTARRGKKKTPGLQQVHSIETQVNPVEMPNDFPSLSQPALTSIPTTTPSTLSNETSSSQISNTVSLSKASNTHLPNMIIKNEPRDPDYDVITLDDSPIKESSKQNVESSFQFPSQVVLPQVSSVDTDISLKRKLLTDPEENVVISDQHIETSKPTSISTVNIDSSVVCTTTTTSSVTLPSGSIPEVLKLIGIPDNILPSIPPLIDSSENGNLEATTTEMSTKPLMSNNTLPAMVSSFIKTEVQDSSELQKNASFPNVSLSESPSFFNCLIPNNVTKESQPAAYQLPITGNISNNFPTAEKAVNSSLLTRKEIQNVLKSCTDAVYSNLLTEEIRLEESSTPQQQVSGDFQMSPILQLASKEQNKQNILGHEIGYSTDAANFASDVSIESLKNIIGFSDFTSEIGTKETSNSASVYSTFDKDSFRLDDDDTSSRTSSFLSRSSPRLPTPLSDCASHRLTDSISPFAKLSENSGKILIQGTQFSQVDPTMNINFEQSLPEDESDGLTIKSVGLKLRYAASLAQNSIADLGDTIPLDDYPVVDGEVECFHKLLLAAFVPKLNTEDNNVSLEENAPEVAESILSEEISLTSHVAIPNVEVNRSSLLDQFISQKIAEEKSLNQEQKELFYRRTPEGKQASSFHTNEPCIKSYVHNEQLSTHKAKLDYYASHCSERSENATELETYVPFPPDEMTYKSKKGLDSYLSPSNSSNTLPSAEDNKNTSFDLSFIPNMLKLISNLKESSSKNTASSKMHSTSKTSNSDSSNKQLEESFSWKTGKSLKGTPFDLEDSKLRGISTVPSTHVSNPFAETSKSTLQQDTVENSTFGSQNDKYFDNLENPISSNFNEFYVPSKELLFNVIKNTQLTSTNESSCSLPYQEPNPTSTTDLVDTSIESHAMKISQGVAVFNSDLHNELSNCEVKSVKIEPENDLVNIEEAESSYVEIIENFSNNKAVQMSEVETISNLAEKITTLFPKAPPTLACKDEEYQVDENLTVEPVKANPVVDKIGIAELLKILNTAKNLQSDSLTPGINPQYSEAYNYEPLQSSCHVGYGNSLTDSRYSYPENYREQYHNYSDSDSMQLKMPIIHEYDHKSRTGSYKQGSVLGASLNANNNASIPNTPTHQNESNASDSDVDNEFLNSETDIIEDSVCEETKEKEQSDKNKKEIAKDEESNDFPQYKSRWERIMERKNQANDRAKLNEHLLEDYYSVKVPKSKPKIQKPIAHVQPCSQKSPKEKVTEKKVVSEKPCLPLKKKKSNQTETIPKSNLPHKKKKTKNAEVILSSVPPLKKKKSNAADVSVNTKVGDADGTIINKKKVDNAEDPSASGPPHKKIKINKTNVISPKSKKSKEGKGISKKQSPVKSKPVSSEKPSDLFAPDKVVKVKNVKYSGVKKSDDEASKRLYGRVTNRGGFLTESSLTQPPKPKTLTGKMSSDKTKSSRIFADELHSMIATPDIRIGPGNEFLQKQSRKLSLEAYKMKKNMFHDPNIGAMSPKVDIFSASCSYRQIPTSSNVLSSLSPDISYQASSDSSDFLSPPDPFASSISVLPHLEVCKSQFSHNVFSTPVNVNHAIKSSPITRRTLLPDPVPNFTKGVFLNDFGLEAQPSQFASPLFSNRSNTFVSDSHNLAPQSASSLTPQPVPPVSIFAQQQIPSISNLVPQPVSPVAAVALTQAPSIASFPSRSHHRLSRSRQTRCVCLPPKTLKASVGQAVFETFDVLLLILEWNVDWLVQQQKCLDPPPICNAVRKVVNKYEDLQDYYNTYLPLLLLETWQRIYASWTHLHQAAPYFCKVTSYTVETHTINVECQAVFRSSDAEKGLVPEKGNIIMIKFGTKEKGGIKILGYVTSAKVTAFDPVSDPQNTCYRTLKYTATEVLQRINLTFVGAYNSEDFDIDLLIRIQVLCNIESILKQNDAMLNIKNSPLHTNILNPLNDGLRIVNVITKHSNPLKVSETVNDCVRDIVKGILSPHPLPLLTIAKSLPSSDRLLVLLPLIEKMKRSYKTKVLLCTRTTKALNDIGFHLEGAVNVVIIGNRVDIHQKLKRYHLDDLAIDKANSSLDKPRSEIPGFQASGSKDAIDNAKMDILKECDVILSNIRCCHTDFIAKACVDGEFIPQMCCIVDEANLCTEPEILIPLLYGISKLILIGDPDVLAKVCSKTAISYGYNRSIFHRANELDLDSE